MLRRPRRRQPFDHHQNVTQPSSCGGLADRKGEFKISYELFDSFLGPYINSCPADRKGGRMARRGGEMTERDRGRGKVVAPEREKGTQIGGRGSWGRGAA